MNINSDSSVAVFGELLLRVSTQTDNFINSDRGISIYAGGSEANVASSLAGMGTKVSYISCIPDNQLTGQALNALEQREIDISKCLFSGDRLGLYFLLSANGLSKGDVVYDRKFSSFSMLRTGMIDWDTLLEGHSWFHWTALTPALNVHLVDVCHEALSVAKKKGLTISVDLNYRNKLWNYGKQPIDVMPDLVSYCDVIMGNIWAANTMLGTPVDTSLDRDTSKTTYLEHATASAEAIFKNFSQCKHIAYTFRFMDAPNHNLFYGTYHTKQANFFSETYETQRVIDRIGSGDAFMGGLIHALTTHKSDQQVVDMATSAGFKKLFVKGDLGDGSY
ncbi:sugar kinase [Olivibacter sp. SDN3]|uniref:sugar kinase n=1 Tax=Olivibacter sp. SDN3 TaxID=2764720 RepID=UPI0016512434|nr:sugar kinase [Olivibacter sp. SDN3]QNL50542.1 sugar kinase [Olivibacter sp. SDN3]